MRGNPLIPSPAPLRDQSFSGAAPVSVRTKVGTSFTAVTNNLPNTHVTVLGYPCNFNSYNIMQRNDSNDHRAGSTVAGNNAFEYGSDMAGGRAAGLGSRISAIHSAPRRPVRAISRATPSWASRHTVSSTRT